MFILFISYVSLLGSMYPQSSTLNLEEAGSTYMLLLPDRKDAQHGLTLEAS